MKIKEIRTIASFLKELGLGVGNAYECLFISGEAKKGFMFRNAKLQMFYELDIPLEPRQTFHVLPNGFIQLFSHLPNDDFKIDFKDGYMELKSASSNTLRLLEASNKPSNIKFFDMKNVESTSIPWSKTKDCIQYVNKKNDLLGQFVINDGVFEWFDANMGIYRKLIKDSPSIRIPYDIAKSLHKLECDNLDFKVKDKFKYQISGEKFYIQYSVRDSKKSYYQKMKNAHSDMKTLFTIDNKKLSFIQKLQVDYIKISKDNIKGCFNSDNTHQSGISLIQVDMPKIYTDFEPFMIKPYIPPNSTTTTIKVNKPEKPTHIFLETGGWDIFTSVLVIQ